MKKASDKCAVYSSVLLIIMLYGGVLYWILVVDVHKPDAPEFTNVHLEVFNQFFVMIYYIYLFFHVKASKEEVIALQQKVTYARDRIFADILDQIEKDFVDMHNVEL